MSPHPPNQANWLSIPLRRQFLSRLRTPGQASRLLIPSLITGALIALTASAANPPALFFALVLAALWLGGASAVREIVDEREWLRQTPHFSLLGYILSKALYAAVLALAQSFILSILVAVVGGTELSVAACWRVLFLVAWAGALMALALSAACRAPATALAHFPLLLVPQVLFSGFLIPLESLTPYVLDFSGRRIVEAPPEFARRGTDSPALRALHALAVTRWGVEALTAAALPDHSISPRRLAFAAGAVSGIPLTLETNRRPLAVVRQAAAALIAGQRPSWTGFDRLAWAYTALLVVFIAGNFGLLCFVTIANDPRKTGT